MLDYLEQLIKEQKWEEALVVAEHLLLNQGNTVDDQLRINLALIIARAYLGEYAGVILLGDHVARMAADLEQWESYLTLHHYLGFSHSVLDQWSEAKSAWLNYVECLERLGRSHTYEVMTWFHLGVVSEKENDLDSAIRYFHKARSVAERNRNSRQVLGVNHALIAAYTKQGKFDAVPPLLASTARYLRHNPDAADWEKARLHHLQVRASFALTTKRFHRAKRIALRALVHADAAPTQQFQLHMILATVAKHVGISSDMVEHYLRARVAAIRARRYDFEVDAAESLYHFVQANPSSLEVPLDQLGSQEIPLAWFEMEEPPIRKPRL